MEVHPGLFNPSAGGEGGSGGALTGSSSHHTNNQGRLGLLSTDELATLCSYLPVVSVLALARSSKSLYAWVSEDVTPYRRIAPASIRRQLGADGRSPCCGGASVCRWRACPSGGRRWRCCGPTSSTCFETSPPRQPRRAAPGQSRAVNRVMGADCFPGLLVLESEGGPAAFCGMCCGRSRMSGRTWRACFLDKAETEVNWRRGRPVKIVQQSLLGDEDGEQRMHARRALIRRRARSLSPQFIYRSKAGLAS